MPLEFQLAVWTLHVVLGTLIVLLGGAALTFCCRQPADRIRVILCTLIASLALPLLVALPGVPRWSLAWITAPEAAKTSAARAARDPRVVVGEETPMRATSPDSTSAEPARREMKVAARQTTPRPAGNVAARDAKQASPDAPANSPAVAATTESQGVTLATAAVAAAMIGYLAFVLLLVVRFAGARRKLNRLYRNSSQAGAAVSDELAAIAGAHAGRVDLRISPEIDAPLTWGALRPVIMLPEAMLAGCADDLRFALAHEWSHVERRDWAAMLLARAVEPVAFYQPLFWWLRRQLALCQDYLADARAAESDATPDRYAQFLVELARRRLSSAPGGALGIAERRSRLFHRVTMLVERENPLRRTCHRWWNLAAVAVALTLLGGVSLVSLHAQQKTPAAAAAGDPAKKPARPERPKDDGKQKQDLPDPITYTGRVVDRATGKPISGATVFVERSLSRDLKTNQRRDLETTEHTTDAEGVYRFTLPPEQVVEPYLYLVVDAKHPHYAPKGRSGYSHTMIQKNLKLGEQPFYAEIKLSPGAEITGTVTSPAGEPLAGAKIQAYTKAPGGDLALFELGAFQDTLTDERGRFRIVAHTPGDGVLWISHKDYAVEARRLRDRRGDWGAFPLEVGRRLEGRVYSAKGEPLAGVTVAARRDGDGEDADEFLNQNSVGNGIARDAKTDAEGRFRIDPLPPGEYRVAVDTRDLRGGDKVFLPRKVTLTDDEPPAPIELRAEPPVYVRATYVDSQGKPRTGHEVHATGRISGEFFFTRSSLPGQDGKLTLTMPHGAEDVRVTLMTNEHSALRWRRKPGGELQNSHEIKLGTLDEDVTGIEIVRYQAPLLLVKAVDEEGKLLEGAAPKLVFKSGSPKDPGSQFINGIEGDLYFEKQQDGRWRSSQLLPDEPFELSAVLEGYTTEPQKLSLPEGVEREVVFEMKPAATSKEE